ncbi:protein HYPER-SENSITIVITY-RELATED 4-like [Dioscorea cayenensis subsp. rotundata]|uniref:Protein HYPER-SENSITIVITY-RELATED 4-like n=1 Tax=Dioscorea cayennensis subsp. rotundata TaxID=55577 RepID=A0AB40CVQ7_DIOCR|nr:protein HYPER-SENSITIVITY-RELATED 4-like [Dioscorea cayenensis subsp. rotundata]
MLDTTMFANTNIKTDTIVSTAMSIAATAVFIRTFATDLIPDTLYSYVSTLFTRLSSQITITIDEFDNRLPNHLFRAAETYLGAMASSSARNLRAAKQDDENAINISIDRGEQVVDRFLGFTFTWRLVSRESNKQVVNYRRNHYKEVSTPSEARSFQLSFHKRNKELAVSAYLPHVITQAKTIKDGAKTLKLYTNDDCAWSASNLRHPATFATLAMEPALKKAIVEDLERFVKRKEYYKRVGKAWKRGYLLYGPPGTGKSSLVAAMAEFLKFDVYDLELNGVSSNSGLRTLLAAMENQSILVVEDIDCSMELQRREAADEEKVTLSGMLNLVDGLWSSSAEEKIIVFTTNHKERLDPALLRPGRMDMHIHMGYCTAAGFRILVSNYHGVDEHPLFGKIDQLIGEVEVSPAEVAEELMKSDDVNVALRGLVNLLHVKKNSA